MQPVVTERVLLSGFNRQRGFTLLELMVVLVIMALTISLAALAVPGQRSSQARQMGQTLLLASRLAQTEALAQGEIIALELQPGGYRFLRYQQDSKQPWAVFDEPELLRGESFEASWRWQLEQPDIPVVTELPRLYFWPDGTLNPFELQLVDREPGDAEPVLWTLRGGVLQLEWYSGKASPPEGNR